MFLANWMKVYLAYWTLRKQSVRCYGGATVGKREQLHHASRKRVISRWNGCIITTNALDAPHTLHAITHLTQLRGKLRPGHSDWHGRRSGGAGVVARGVVVWGLLVTGVSLSSNWETKDPALVRCWCVSPHSRSPRITQESAFLRWNDCNIPTKPKREDPHASKKNVSESNEEGGRPCLCVQGVGDDVLTFARVVDRAPVDGPCLFHPSTQTKPHSLRCFRLCSVHSVLSCPHDCDTASVSRPRDQAVSVGSHKHHEVVIFWVPHTDAQHISFWDSSK